MRRGDVYWYSFQAPDKRRPVMVLTRDSAIPILDSVTVAPVTTTVRGIPTEVELTRDDGMPQPCAANFDNLQTVAKQRLGEHITRLSPQRLAEAAAAISFALGLDDT
ncbi:MAG: type II toxin-antitoxin system PemK/MazF family toxin [Nevskiaceae bacterium]